MKFRNNLKQFYPAEFLNSREFSDLRIICRSGEKFHAHKFVFGIFAEILRVNLSSAENDEDLAVVILPDFDGSEVKSALEMIYGCRDFNRENRVLDALGCFKAESGVKRVKVAEEEVKAVKYAETRIYPRNGNGEFECPVAECGYKSGDKKKVHNHVSVVHRKVKCPKCDKRMSRKNVRGHVKRVHSNNGKKDVNKRVLAKKKAKNDDEEEDNFVANENDPNKCSKCDFTSDKMHKMKKHYREYHEKPFCPHCNKRYSFYFLDRHIKTAHTKELAFQCEICPEKFYRERHLKHHVDENHVKELKFICESCGERFFSQHTLSRHKTKRHSSKGQRSFPCQKCDKTYQSKGSLKKHQVKQHNHDDDDVETMIELS